MKRAQIVLALLPVLVSTGCASKQDLEAARTQAAACEQEKLKLEASVISWEERFDRESDRWVGIEASVTEALPASLEEFHTERQRIIELVPEQVKSEVTAYLEDYFSAVMKGFTELSKDNAEIKSQLQATHHALQAVGADTRAIGTSIEETVAEERLKRETDQARRARTAERRGEIISELVEQVVQFDQNRINCKQCPERLKLNRGERETLLAFHAELIADLTDLQSYAGAPMADFPLQDPPMEDPPAEEAGDAGP